MLFKTKLYLYALCTIKPFIGNNIREFVAGKYFSSKRELSYAASADSSRLG